MYVFSVCRLFLRAAFLPLFFHDLRGTQPIDAKDPNSELARVDKGKTRPQTVAKGLGMKVSIIFYGGVLSCCCTYKRAGRAAIDLQAAREGNMYRKIHQEGVN